MAKTTTYKSIAGLNRALRSLPAEAQAEFKTASVAIARDIAGQAQQRAKREGGLAAIVAPTINATNDRGGKIVMGGSTPLPVSGGGWSRARSGSNQTVGNIVWGAEFGGRARRVTRGGGSTMQFQPYVPSPTGHGGFGYFLWPTIRDAEDEIIAGYSKATAKMLKEFG